MNHRFIECEDEEKTNHGKFWIGGFGPQEQSYKSSISGKPLLQTLPPVTRFGGGITQSSLFLLDLQTQEGILFDPEQDEALIRRRFLVHPIHVCILYFPLMRYLGAHKKEIWKLPKLISLDLSDVLNQPGILLDSTGRQVRTRVEWSARSPLTARLRNRAVPIEEDGQGTFTEEELQEARNATRPSW